MSDIVLSFSYNGNHTKNPCGNDSHISYIDPISHMQMLIAAIDCVNPKNEHTVIVSALNFNIWSMSKEQRQYALEIYKRATFVFDYPIRQGHHSGAGKSIRMSLEGATAINAKHMIHLAEDVVMTPDTVDYFVRHLKEADYVGSYWHISGREKEFLNTQVFGCNPKVFFEKDLIPEDAHTLEGEMCSRIKSSRIKFLTGANDKYILFFPENRTLPHKWNRGFDYGELLYEHTHDPLLYRSLVEAKGVKWTEFTNKKPTFI